MSEKEKIENQNTPPLFDVKENDQEKEAEIKKIIDLVDQLKDESTRVKALEELSQRRESFTDLALYIWYSTGTVVILLQEIIQTYQILSNPPKLTINISNRLCSVLALFQCIASHPETKIPFLQAQILIFLYPFLNTLNKAKPYEYIRLTALGVIGSLIKIDSSIVIEYLLNTEIIPLCLRIMERGSELSKTVACFIVQKIISDDGGLKYICEKNERLDAINSVLSFMLKNKPSIRLLKHIIRAYNKLAENENGKKLLKLKLPPEMKTREFLNTLDDSSKKWLFNLFKLLKDEKTIMRMNQNDNNGINNDINIHINMNMNNNMVGNFGLQMDLNNINNMNNNQEINNAMMMNQNMLMLNQMNLQQNQGYMTSNEYQYKMYNEQYLNNGIYMGNINNNGYTNMNNAYRNKK